MGPEGRFHDTERTPGDSCRLRPSAETPRGEQTACSPGLPPLVPHPLCCVKGQNPSGLQTDVAQKGAQMLFYLGRSPREIRAVLVEVHRVCHRCAPVAEELLPVLGGDDPHGMGRPAMAKGLDWNLRQSRLFQDASPTFGQAEKGRAGLVARDGQMLGARRTGHGPDQPDRFGTKEDPSPAFAAPVPLGAGHSNPGNRAVEPALLQRCLEQLRAIAGAGIDRKTQGEEGSEWERRGSPVCEPLLEVAKYGSYRGVPRGVQELPGSCLLVSRHQAGGGRVPDDPLSPQGKVEGSIELLQGPVRCRASPRLRCRPPREDIGRNLPAKPMHDIGRDLCQFERPDPRQEMHPPELVIGLQSPLAPRLAPVSRKSTLYSS